MKYDFYMFCATPVEMQRKYSAILQAFDIKELAEEQIAMFRDPEVVERIATASEDVRNCFLDAGFALTSYDRGIRGGGFPVEDTEARADVLKSVRNNIAAMPDDTDWNGIDVDEFLAVAEAAQPVKRERKTFAKARRAIVPVLELTSLERVTSRVVSRTLSKPAPGL